jgi:phage gp36-like protein
VNRSLTKSPAEALRPTLAFASALPIAAVLSVDIAERGGGAGNLSAGAEVVDGLVVAHLAGGRDGERYGVTVLAQDADGAELEIRVELVVIESDWRTPDGGAPWLPIAAFVRRFGLDEVIAMTDRDGSGRIDRELLVEALIDAQAEAEAAIAGRYRLPLASVPRVIEAAIADRARARLYPRGCPEGVEKMAAAASRFLADVAAGRATLGLPPADQPEAASSDAPVLITPGRRAYPDGLADY